MFHRSFNALFALAAVAAPLAAQRTEVYTVPPSGAPGGMGYTTMTASRRAIIGVTVTTRPTDGDTIGATIGAVTPGGPAAQAGIVGGDIITKFNGTALAERRSQSQSQSDDAGPDQSGPGLKLIELVSRVSPGDTVTVEWRHDRARKTARVATQSAGNVWVTGEDGFRVFNTPTPGAFTYDFQMGPRPGEMAPLQRELELHGLQAPMMQGGQVFLRMGGPLGGVQFAPINADLGRYFGVTDGILVLETPDTSAHVDLKGGDVILSIGDRKPTSVERLFRILSGYDDEEIVSLDVMRDKRHVTVTAKAEDVRGGGRIRMLERELAPTVRPDRVERVPMETPAPPPPRAKTPRSGT